MDMLIPVMSRIPIVLCAFSPVVVSIILVAFSVTSVVLASSRKSGDKIQMLVLSTANVSHEFRTHFTGLIQILPLFSF